MRVIIGLVTLLLNYTMMFFMFERRFGRLVSYGVPVLYTIVFYLFIFFTGLQQSGIKYTGLLHIIVIIFVLKGQFFQKIFAFLLQLLIVAAFMIIAAAIASAVMQNDNNHYHLIFLLITLVLYGAYAVFLRFAGRRILIKMFVEARNKEWAFYSLTVFISYYMLVKYQGKALAGSDYMVLLFYILWNVIILCYAVITTHEKSKQKYEAEHAREIITSGKEHYQKMNEMYDDLRIMRHDYKYHMDVISELIKTGNEDKIDQYLTLLKDDLSKKEFPVFCSNSVLNALIASYAERFARLDAKYVVKIALPDKSIPNYEMCIVLGNLLQNAMEACSRLAANRIIELTINMKGAHLVTMVKNNFDGAIAHASPDAQQAGAAEKGGQNSSLNGSQNGSLPASTKPGGGFGLRSVQAIASRYDGELIAEWDESTFTVYVMVKLPENPS